MIAVERPGGEQSRLLAPFGRPDGGSSATPVDGGMSVPYLKRGRGKRSVAVARRSRRSLVAPCGASPTSSSGASRPGVMARLRARLLGPRGRESRPDLRVDLGIRADGSASRGARDGPGGAGGVGPDGQDRLSRRSAGAHRRGGRRLLERRVRGDGCARRAAPARSHRARPARRPLDARCPDRARVGRTGRSLRGHGYARSDGKRRPARRADQRVPGRRRVGRRDPHHVGTVEAARCAARPAGMGTGNVDSDHP